jgi:hypothetical protein
MPGALVRLSILMRRLQPDVVMTWLNHAHFLATFAAIVSGVRASRVVWNLSASGPNASDGTSSKRFKRILLAGLSRLPWGIAAGSLSERRSYEAVGYRPRRWFPLSNSTRESAIERVLASYRQLWRFVTGIEPVPVRPGLFDLRIRLRRKMRSSKLYWKVFAALQDAIAGSFDRRYGIDTRGWISVGELRSREPLRPRESRGYAGTPPRQFSQLIQALAVPTKEYHFVDVGSGKGRIAILAAMHDFHAVTGIELSETFHDVALRNLAALRNFGVMKCEPELLNMNALEYEFPRSPLLLYLFNPFDGTAMERFVDRIAKTYQESPRHILVAYHTARCARFFKHHALFKEIKLGGSRLPRIIRVFEIPAAPSPYRMDAVRPRDPRRSSDSVPEEKKKELLR